MGVSTTARWSLRQCRSHPAAKRGRWPVAERMRLDGRTAVVTGAAGGIGRAIAVSLARRGCHLALADIDETGMAGTVELISKYGVRVSHHRIDVADRAAVAEFPDIV